MSIQLIAFDLDGTLLDDKKQISEVNRDTLTEAADRGIYLVPCTARLLNTIPAQVKNLPFVRFVITVNGAEVYDRKERQAIYKAEIEADVAERLFDYMETLPVIYDCYQNGRGWIDRVFYEQTDRWIQDEHTIHLIRGMRTPVDNFRRVMRERNLPIQKTQMFFGDSDLRLEEMRRVKEKFPMCSVTSSLYNNIEINAGQANKGKALETLCGYLGISLSDSIALGDGGNDISMLKTAGIGIAMGNAPEEVKQAADRVTACNEDNGVAKAIRRYALQA